MHAVDSCRTACLVPRLLCSEFAISYTTAGADQFAVSFAGFVVHFCTTSSNCPSEWAGRRGAACCACAFELGANQCCQCPWMPAGNNFCAVAICVNADVFGAVIKAVTDAYNAVSLPTALCGACATPEPGPKACGATAPARSADLLIPCCLRALR